MRLLLSPLSVLQTVTRPSSAPLSSLIFISPGQQTTFASLIHTYSNSFLVPCLLSLFRTFFRHTRILHFPFSPFRFLLPSRTFLASPCHHFSSLCRCFPLLCRYFAANFGALSAADCCGGAAVLLWWCGGAAVVLWCCGALPLWCYGAVVLWAWLIRLSGGS